jgi:hypothetical protein
LLRCGFSLLGFALIQLDQHLLQLSRSMAPPAKRFNPVHQHLAVTQALGREAASQVNDALIQQAPEALQGCLLSP